MSIFPPLIYAKLSTNSQRDFLFFTLAYARNTRANVTHKATHMCQKTCEFIKLPAKHSWLLNRQRRILNFDVVNQMTTYFLSHLSIPFWLLWTKNSQFLNQFGKYFMNFLPLQNRSLPPLSSVGIWTDLCSVLFRNQFRKERLVIFISSCFVVDMTGVRRKKAQRKRRVNTTKVGSKRKKKDKKVKVLK